MAQKVSTKELHASRLFSVEGWVCLVTGGGTGIGLMCAQALAAWTRWAPVYQSSELFKRFDWPQWSVIKRVLGIGLPIGVAIFAESSIFAVIALLIGSLGATVVAGHQIALNFSSLVFMIPYSLSMAVTVRVGQALGRGGRGLRM